MNANERLLITEYVFGIKVSGDYYKLKNYLRVYNIYTLFFLKYQL